MPRKTTREFGTIEKTGTTIRARYIGPDGRRYSKGKFRTKREAYAWLAEEEHLLATKEWRPPKARQTAQLACGITLKDWATEWLDLQQTRLKPSTLQMYNSRIKNRICPETGAGAALQHLPLASITRRDIIFWWDEINKAYPTPAGNFHAYRTLTAILQAAVDREYLTQNPAQKIKAASTRPKPKRKELPSTDEMLAIVQAMHPRHRLIAILTFFHGMRIGEALALRRKDITVTNDGATIHVRGTMYRDAHKGMVRLDRPKTAAGERDIPFFSRFLPELKEHLEKYASKTADGLLFVTEYGKPIWDTSYRSRLKYAKKKAGLEDLEITPHYGRVWLITELAEKGLPIPAIGRILGQTDLKTITEIYMRAHPDTVKSVLAQVEAAI